MRKYMKLSLPVAALGMIALSLAGCDFTRRSSAPSVRKVDVIVAAVPIQPGDTLSLNNLAKNLIPETEFTEAYLRTYEYRDILGHKYLGSLSCGNCLVVGQIENYTRQPRHESGLLKDLRPQ